MRIKDLLDLAKGLVNDRAEHLAIPLAARQTVAVLAAQRAAELQDQVGDFLRNLPHPCHVGTRLQIQKWPDVQTADAGVTVKGAVGAMLLEKVAETRHKLRQPGRR